MAIIKKYLSEVVSVNKHNDCLYSITIKSLKGKYKYSAGQFLHFSLDEYDPTLGWPDSRCFSIQSSPQDEFIKFTFSVKGIYTSRMANELHVGKLVSLKLPYGDLFLQIHSKEETVFISGGTGITPFLSLFTDPEFALYRKPVLYAGFRDSTLNIYDNELEIARRINPDFKIYYVFQVEHGVLDKGKILARNNKNSSFFISGPQNMINSFNDYFLKNGIKQSQINSDNWE
jgi:predicted ferric reductase